jgi:delta14-sterol reductase
LCDASAMTDVALDGVPAAEQARGKVKKDEASHFGGPAGAVLFITLLPLISLYLWIVIHRHGGALVLPGPSLLGDIPWPTPRAALFVGGWLAFQVALQVLLPGKVVQGIPQRDGLRIPYKLNGLASLIVTLALGAGLYAAGLVTGRAVLAELGPMLAIAVLCAFTFSAFLYLYGFSSTRTEYRTEIFIYDYFMGTALNPRIKDFDLKLFFESKIGMTTWIVITFAMAAAQYERDGSVSLAMALVCLFQLWYVADFYVFENAMLTTWDINYENYGFMLLFGFVVWMPFNFSLQAQYLVYHRPELSIPAVLGIVALNFAGYYVFRTSNLQKHAFRTHPDAKIWGKPPTFIQTQRGTKLLTSGWWGLARHTNYLGDLMMALAWCLPTGISHVPPYFYFIYFAPLLIDRERRDHKVCAKKYGADWDTYCKKVKYRIVPFVY